MFTTSDRQESYERDLHACQRAKSIPGAIADIYSWTKASHANQHKYVKRNQIGNEDVSSPSRNHISVE
jgi:hypothetical protein